MVSDTASHFKNCAMKTLEGALRVEHRFAMANLPRSNGKYEWMMREVMRALKTIWQEEKRDICQRVDVVPAVHTADARDTLAHCTTLCSGGRRRPEKTGKWMHSLKRLYEKGGERCGGAATTVSRNG